METIRKLRGRGQPCLKGKSFEAFSLLGLLVALVITSVLMFIALPDLMPLISKAKSFMERGNANYKIEKVNENGFRAKVYVVIDLDGDEKYYAWQATIRPGLQTRNYSRNPI